MAVEFKIVRIKGFDLNPDDNKVNNIIHALAKNGGRCPNEKNFIREGHVYCPCNNYLTNKECVCNLYVKTNEES